MNCFPLILPLAAALVLAACSKEQPAPADERAAPAGEVLEGSISDAMIPYDELRSQPPLEEVVADNITGTPGPPGATPSPSGPASPASGDATGQPAPTVATPPTPAEQD